MNPRIDARDARDVASPKRWGSALPGMAWHHIIPLALLREVWNRLVDQHIATELPDARVAIRQYLLLSDHNQPTVDALIDRMRAENRHQQRAGHHHLPALSVAEAHRLVQAAVWPAWNIVEGPRRRSDDPGDQFDRFTSGLTGEDGARMKAIEVLFPHLRSFTNAGLAPGPGSLRALAEAVSLARRVVRCDLPIRYRPEMWVDEGAGLFHKRRDRERNNPAA